VHGGLRSEHVRSGKARSALRGPEPRPRLRKRLSDRYDLRSQRLPAIDL
jgi:hypothetical protein